MMKQVHANCSWQKETKEVHHSYWLVLTLKSYWELGMVASYTHVEEVSSLDPNVVFMEETGSLLSTLL